MKAYIWTIVGVLFVKAALRLNRSDGVSHQ